MLGEWTGASVEPGEGVPEPEVWTPVEVPGVGSAFSGADAVAYRTEFADPRAEGSERVVLRLAGLYAHARVWVNGDLVGSHDSYARPFRVPIDPEPENELVVECRAPEDRFGGIHDTDAVPAEDAVPGIWWGAELETHPESYIARLDVQPRIEDGEAMLDVRAVVDAAEAIDDRLTFSLRPEGEFQSRGMMDRAAVQAEAGERVTVEHTIDVRDPSLWWPRELGQPHRYTVRAKLDGETRSVTTGLCSIDRDEAGLVVNGERLRARGVTLRNATVADVDRAVEANANLVRFHAHVPSPAVYDACDEAGLLVWQDLPLTGPGEFDVERGRTVASDVASAVGNHPSLAAVAVHDDPVDLFPEPLGAGVLNRLRLRWRCFRASHDAAPAEAIAEEVPDGVLAFPVVGPIGTDPDAAAVYPGWDYGSVADVDWILDRYGVDEVVAAFGVGALGSSDPEEAAGFDRAKHDARTDADSSQGYQAAVLKRVAETLRRRSASITVANALRDTDEAGMGVLERDGTAKVGFRALQASFEPVVATLTTPRDDVESDVVVVNDTAESLSGRLEWDAGVNEGSFEVTVEAHGRATAGSIPIPAGTSAVTLALSVGDRRIENTYRL